MRFAIQTVLHLTCQGLALVYSGKMDAPANEPDDCLNESQCSGKFGKGVEFHTRRKVESATGVRAKRGGARWNLTLISDHFYRSQISEKKTVAR